MLINVIYLILFSVNSVLCCSTFNNTEIKVLLQDLSSINFRVTGCIQESVFYPYVIESIIIDKSEVRSLKEDSIINMPQLKSLELKTSKLSSIYPGMFKNVPHLDGVSFSENELTEIPSGAFDVKTLRHLYLDNNKINFIETTAFSLLEKLVFLTLEHNELDSINGDWFYNLRQLRAIDLSHNKIRSIPPKSFVHAKSVKSIYLDYNYISEIRESAFEGFTDLSLLGLRNNLLKRINLSSFPPKFELIRILNINSNKLSFLSKGLLEQIRISKLIFDGNPWQCGCYVKMLRYLDENRTKINFSPECKNYTGSVCIVRPLAGNSCIEHVDDELIQDFFYQNQRSLDNTTCFQSLKIT